MDRFDEMLRNARKAKGLTQQQLADKLDLTSAYIAKLEKGGNCPRSQVIEELSEALDLPLLNAYLAAQLEGKLSEGIRTVLLELRRERVLMDQDPDFSSLVRTLASLSETERGMILEILKGIIAFRRYPPAGDAEPAVGI